MYHYTFIGKLDVQNTFSIIGVKWLFSLNNSGLTVFLSLERGDMLSPAMMAINELKLPMLKHSRAVSIQNSTTLTRCFFLACWKPISPLTILQQFFIKKSSKQSASTISSTFYSKTWIENQFFIATFEDMDYFLAPGYGFLKILIEQLKLVLFCFQTLSWLVDFVVPSSKRSQNWVCFLRLWSENQNLEPNIVLWLLTWRDWGLHQSPWNCLL